jgi:protein-S-isoprenylcysteine O-methyltransferase
MVEARLVIALIVLSTLVLLGLVAAAWPSLLLPLPPPAASAPSPLSLPARAAAAALGGLPAPLPQCFSLYVALLAGFHLGEWAWSAAWQRPRGGRFSSLLLDANWPAYQVAVALAFAEFAAGAALAPGAKAAAARGAALLPLGGALAGAGLALRAAAMWTARGSFAHVLAQGARPPAGHALCTSGVYALARHPAYAGWFAWAVGSQLLLANPLCAAAYAAAAAAFFRERIADEERALLRFYGAEYAAYARRTRVWLPVGTTPADEAAAAAGT